MTRFDHTLLIWTDPRTIIRGLVRRGASFRTRLRWDALEYPQYAYGLLRAGLQARALGIGAISALELGVAGGNGLVALETHADAVEAYTGVRIEVVGFDAGKGMPEPADVRDLPYIWRKGYFEMDEPALRARLRRSELVIGDVRTTVPEFVRRPGLPPVGFVSFDVDYYTSTVAGLEVLEGPAEAHLPRTFVYLDDIVGGDEELHSPFAGELLAVEEFNARHADRKLAPINGLRHKRMIPGSWNDQLYVCHDFAHERYADHLGPPEWDLPLI